MSLFRDACHSVNMGYLGWKKVLLKFLKVFGKNESCEECCCKLGGGSWGEEIKKIMGESSQISDKGLVYKI